MVATHQEERNENTIVIQESEYHIYDNCFEILSTDASWIVCQLQNWDLYFHIQPYI